MQDSGICPPVLAHHTSHIPKSAQAPIPFWFTPKRRAFGATESKGMWSGVLPRCRGLTKGQRAGGEGHNDCE